jgi:UDP-N-acetylmuramyl pentapeptide synthase
MYCCRCRDAITSLTRWRRGGDGGRRDDGGGKAGLAQLKAVPGRLFPIQLTESQLLLDDSYNANVGSMTAAVQVLSEMPGFRAMVVGDMAELGAESAACHREVGEAAKAAGWIASSASAP